MRFLGFVGAVALAVLAYAGQVKSLPGMNWIPVDLTVLSAAAVAACLGLLLLSRGPSKGILVPLGLFWCFLYPAFMVTLTPYGTQKLLTLFTFTLICAVAPFFVLRTERLRRTFLGTLVVLAAAVALMSYQSGALQSVTASSFADISPIGISRLMATGVVVLLVLTFAKGSKLKWRLLMLAGSCGLLLMIFTFGRRGPVLAIVVGVVLALAFAPAFRKYRVRAMFAGVVALAGAGWYSVQQGSAGVERVLSFFNGEADASTAAREYIWDEAFAIMGQYPLGIGWASFPSYAHVDALTNRDGRMYPHNIFLEGFVEGGWLVGLLLLLFVAIAFIRLMRNATTSTLAVFLGLAGFALTNALVSGDLNDQKLLWVALSVAFLPRKEPDDQAPKAKLPAVYAQRPGGVLIRPSRVPGTEKSRTPEVASSTRTRR